MSWTLEIDSDMLSHASTYYEEKGFAAYPTPWLVEHDAYFATFPVHSKSRPWQAPNGMYHVASAEQGFLQLLLDGHKLSGRFQSTTPCFRDEERYDAIHQPYFYKLELFSSCATEEEVSYMLLCAQKLLKNLGLNTKIVQMKDGSYDLLERASGIELGSYGTRKHQQHTWAYGTGIAMPRTQYCIEKSKT